MHKLRNIGKVPNNLKIWPSLHELFSSLKSCTNTEGPLVDTIEPVGKWDKKNLVDAATEMKEKTEKKKL